MDEVEKGKQLDHLVGLLVEARGELKNLECGVDALRRSQKPQESDMRQIGVVLEAILSRMKKLRSDITLLELGVAMKVPPSPHIDRKE